MILQLHFDILSVEVGISAILPFSCFLVHHAEKPRLMRWEKIEYAESVVTEAAKALYEGVLANGDGDKHMSARGMRAYV